MADTVPASVVMKALFRKLPRLGGTALNKDDKGRIIGGTGSLSPLGNGFYLYYLVPRRGQKKSKKFEE